MLVGNFLHYFIAIWGLPLTMSRWTKEASFKHRQPYPATTPKVVNTNKLCYSTYPAIVCLPKSNWQIWALKLSKNHKKMHRIDTKTDLRVHFYSPRGLAWSESFGDSKRFHVWFMPWRDWDLMVGKYDKVLLESWEAPFLHLTVAMNIIRKS